MGLDAVQEKLKALRKEIQDTHKELMRARADYEDLRSKIFSLGDKTVKLYLLLDKMLDFERDEKCKPQNDSS